MRSVNLPRAPRILLIGAQGQVGHELRRALAPLGTVIAWGRAELDLTDIAQIGPKVGAIGADMIVNASAYTAVDRAETEPDVAYAVNAHAVAALAEVAVATNAVLVHYSTDYVFDGQREGAYSERIAPSPLGVYGQSKRAGEEAIETRMHKYLIFRTSWVFGVHGGNFLKTILRLAADRERLTVVADQFGAPTAAGLIADVTAHVLHTLWYTPEATSRVYGLYHLAAAGEASWYDYARYLVEGAHARGMDLRLAAADIAPIPATDYPLPAPRPANSRLDCNKLMQTFGLALPDWRVHVDWVLDRLCSPR